MTSTSGRFPARMATAPEAKVVATRRQAGRCNSMITVRKVMRSLTAVMPGWLIVICGVCLAIPLARLAALLFTAGLCLIQPARVPVLRPRSRSNCDARGAPHRRCIIAGAQLTPADRTVSSTFAITVWSAGAAA